MKVPSQTKLLLNATETVPESAISAQALAAMYASGWPDPLPPHVAAAIYMGCSYVMNLGQQAYDSDSITAQEYAAVQGVSGLAMQIWKSIHEGLPQELE
jgi:hypothetical protein